MNKSPKTRGLGEYEMKYLVEGGSYYEFEPQFWDYYEVPIELRPHAPAKIPYNQIIHGN